MEITEAFGGKQFDHSRLGVAQKSEKALAIKQGWQQAFDVLDINLDHGSLNYSFDQNDESIGKFINQQPVTQVSLVDEGTTPEASLGELVYTSAEAAGSLNVKGNQFATVSSFDIGNEQPAAVISGALLQGYVFFNANSGIAKKAVPISDTRQLNEVVLAKKSELILIGNVSNYREAATKDAAQKVAGNSSANTMVTVKQEAEAAQPSQVSLAKVEGGFMILARDYRINEKVFTRKLVDSLKSILLAGGVLKKILMNGKTIF